MKTQIAKTADSAPLLVKADATTPALIVTGPRGIAIKAGTVFLDNYTFNHETPLVLPTEGLVPGTVTRRGWKP